MNRKAQSAFDIAHTTLFWAFMGIIATFIVLGTAFLFVSYKNRLGVMPAELKAEMLSLRFTHNPDCFAYVDLNTGKVRTGSIDMAKFNQEQMDSCYQTEKGSPAKDLHFRLEVTGQERLSNDYTRNNVAFTIYREVLLYAPPDTSSPTHLTPSSFRGKQQLTIDVEVR